MAGKIRVGAGHLGGPCRRLAIFLQHEAVQACQAGSGPGGISVPSGSRVRSSVGLGIFQTGSCLQLVAVGGYTPTVVVVGRRTKKCTHPHKQAQKKKKKKLPSDELRCRFSKHQPGPHGTKSGGSGTKFGKVFPEVDACVACVPRPCCRANQAKKKSSEGV